MRETSATGEETTARTSGKMPKDPKGGGPGKKVAGANVPTKGGRGTASLVERKGGDKPGVDAPAGGSRGNAKAPGEGEFRIPKKREAKTKGDQPVKALESGKPEAGAAAGEAAGVRRA